MFVDVNRQAYRMLSDGTLSARTLEKVYSTLLRESMPVPGQMEVVGNRPSFIAFVLKYLLRCEAQPGSKTLIMYLHVVSCSEDLSVGFDARAEAEKIKLPERGATRARALGSRVRVRVTWELVQWIWDSALCLVSCFLVWFAAKIPHEIVPCSTVVLSFYC